MRLSLGDGKTTPQFVDSALAVFGANPHGEPQYRLIWSERKRIYFAGEICPEYTYLEPCWILETWTPPEKDAGPEENWQATTFGLLGPYPREGTYNFVRQFPSDWFPSEANVRLLCVGLEKSKHVPIKERARAIRENKEAENAAARQKVADTILELSDSASLGKTQQPVSGPKNNFRTTDDWERDQSRVIAVKDLPKTGGKIY
jgi:hypothetical protein